MTKSIQPSCIRFESSRDPGRFTLEICVADDGNIEWSAVTEIEFSFRTAFTRVRFTRSFRMSGEVSIGPLATDEHGNPSRTLSITLNASGYRLAQDIELRVHDGKSVTRIPVSDLFQLPIELCDAASAIE